jgi:hypothetical protein
MFEETKGRPQATPVDIVKMPPIRVRRNMFAPWLDCRWLVPRLGITDTLLTE